MTRPQTAIYSESADYSNIPEIKIKNGEESESSFLAAAEALLWRWIMVLFALNVFAVWICSRGEV